MLLVRFTWLQKRGFDVENVSSISEGYKILDSKKIDLILSDLRLPDYDGIDLLKWIKRKEKTTPVIVMTGYADVSSAVQAMNCPRIAIAEPIRTSLNIPGLKRYAQSIFLPLSLTTRALVLANCVSASSFSR